VVSSTLGDPGWANSTVLRGDPVAEVAALKAAPGRDIVLTGSISLAHALMAAGAVDELRLNVYPTVQGRGRRLVPDGLTLPRLSVLEPARTFPSGVTLLKYRVG
jgi:dihydrofolate reductase